MSAPMVIRINPYHAAEMLRQALERHGVVADVHHGYGLALVSVWVGVVVWCDGQRFWWRTGWNVERRRVIYAWHPAIEPVRAAHRISMHYSDLRRRQSYSLMIAAFVDEADE